MNRPVDILALVLGSLALLCWLIHVVRQRRLVWTSPLVLFGAVLALLAASGWLLPQQGSLPAILAIAAAVLFVGLVVLLLLTGDWWPQVVLGVLGLGLFALGGLVLNGAALGLQEAGLALVTVELLHPYWLLLLLLLPGLLALASHQLGFVSREEKRWFWRWVFPVLSLAPLVALVGLVLLVRWGGWMTTAYPEMPQSQRQAYLLWTALAGGLLLLTGVVWYAARVSRRLRQETWRPWLSLALRCSLIVVLALALAEPRLRQMNENLTVLFVVDRSQSIPEELVANPKEPGTKVDRRAERVLTFINNAVQQRGTGRERDRAGLIVFGRRPRLELLPSDAPRFNLDKLPPAVDSNYTDIAAALKLALASFPEGTGKRLVLVSDGNENLGNAEEQARLAKSLGVQIDVLPLAAGQRNEDEVLVERVEAPPLTEQGNNIPIRVLVRSYNPNRVQVELSLKQITEGERELEVKRLADGSLGPLDVDLLGVAAAPEGRGVRLLRVAPGSPLEQKAEKDDVLLKVDDVDLKGRDRVALLLARKKPGDLAKLTLRRNPVKLVENPPRVVWLKKGLNSFSFTRPLTDEQRSYTYEAEIQTLGLGEEVDLGDGKTAIKMVRPGRLPGDRVQNNRASTHVVARGQKRILLLENRQADRELEIVNEHLVENLRAEGKNKLRVDVRSIGVLNNYPDREKLAVYLSDYDCVILANVPADKVSEEQQEAIRSNTHEQGCGLVMIGGPESYGAGGWQNTAVEKALPVDCEIKSLEVKGKGGLVLIMHASEMADGNMWQKKIAKLAIERLGPTDMVGVLDFDFQVKWHIPFQTVGVSKARLLAAVDKMMPGDMPDFDPALLKAHQALTNPLHNLSTKHCIVISDGDPQHNPVVLQPFKRDKVTVTTVGVACHGVAEDNKMAAIAKATGGRPYSVKNPNQLPAIYIKESRLISQSFVEEKRFRPIVNFRMGPTDKLADPPDLTGFVRTTAKPSPLVEIPIITPRFADMEFPLLAYWHYGLGKAVAFTSDAGDPRFWSRDWLEGGRGKDAMYAKFWKQVIDWCLRPTESSRLSLTTEYRDGKIKITVDAKADRTIKDKDGKERVLKDQPDTDLQLRGGITTPNEAGPKKVLKFVQKNSGVYEAEIKAEDAGSYFINAQAVRIVKVKGKDGKIREVEEGVDSVRSGVTLPYSPEFADLESNTVLLEKLRELTDGQTYQDDDLALTEAAQKGLVFRPGLPRVRSQLPLWHYLIFLAGVLLFFDVAVRRIAVDTSEVRNYAVRVWARLRGHVVPEPERAVYLERLQTRKVQVGQGLEQNRPARRFEAGPGGLAAPAGADASRMPTTPAGPAPRPAGSSAPAPAEPEATGDALERLQQRKKKVREDWNKDTQ